MGGMVSSPIVTSMGSNNQLGVGQNHRHRDDLIGAEPIGNDIKTNASAKYDSYIITSEHELEQKLMYTIFGGVIVILTILLLLTIIGWAMATKRARRYANALAYHQGRMGNAQNGQTRNQREEDQLLMAGKAIYLDTSVPKVPNHAVYASTNGVPTDSVC